MKHQKLTHTLTAVLALGFGLIAHTTVASPECNAGKTIALRGPFSNNRVDPLLLSKPALAYANSPEAAVDRSLNLVLAAEQEPTEQRLKALNDAFGPGAMAFIRPEVEHLLSGGLHLGGASGYDVSVLTTVNPSPDQAEVRTQERWTYDERNAREERARCLIERSEQTYTLQRAGPEWQVADIQLATSSRTDCSSG